MTVAKSSVVARLAMTGAAAGALLFGAQAQDQAPPPEGDVPTGVEEIVVTAEKRKTQLQKTPSAITALSSAKIENQGITGVTELQFTVPAMTFGQNSGYTFISLRGVGTDVTTTAAEPSVATYSDGIYSGMLFTQSMPEFDLERIEVLRGPQGTLYGRNAVGGVINYISKAPSFENEANLAVTVGSYNRGVIDAGVTGPIVDDKLAYRASFHYEDRDGYRHNLALDRDEDALEEFGGRVSLLYEPTEDVSITLQGDYLRHEATGNPYVLIETTPECLLTVPACSPPPPDPRLFPLDFVILGAAGSGVLSQPASYFAPGNPGAGLLTPADVASLNGGSIAELFGLITPGPLAPSPEESTDFSVQTPTRYDTETGGASMTVDWDVGTVNVKSLTGFRYAKLTFEQESVGFAVPNVYFYPAVHDANQWTQEFNVSGTAFDDKLDWLVGAFYFHEKSRFNTNIFLPATGQSLSASLSLFDPGVDHLIALHKPDGSLRDLLPASVFLAAGCAANPILCTVTIDGTDPFDNNAPLIADVSIPSTPFLGFRVSQVSESIAGFADLTYHLSDRLRLKGGLRYTVDEKDVVRSAHNSFGGSCHEKQESEEWSALTGAAGVDYDLAEKTLVYAKYAKGYKAGGFNVGQCEDVLNPEKLDSFEVGIKSIFGDGQFSVSSAAFYYDYKDIQFTKYVNGASILVNAGAAELYGLEAEFQAYPDFLPGLQIDGSFSWVHSEYTEGNPFPNFPFGPGGPAVNDGLFEDAAAIDSDPATPGLQGYDIVGNQLIRSPEWKFSMGAQYDIDMGSTGRLTPRVDVAWSDKYYNDIFNGNTPGQDTTQPAYWIVNARLTWEVEDGKYRIQLFGENLTDELYANNRVTFNTPATLVNVAGQFAAPRTVGLRVSMSLNGI